MKNMTELLLTHRADVNAKTNQGVTPLHMAVQYGRKDLADLLMLHWADINAKTNQGLTPSHMATKYDYKDIVELLLTSKVDMNVNTRIIAEQFLYIWRQNTATTTLPNCC